MAKKKAETQQIEKTASEYYRLHTKAVDDLVNANAGNSPKVSEEELRKYRSGFSKFKFSDWVKIVFVKFWFPASVCYFMIWGLGLYVSATLDLLFITGIAMGVITDLLTNNAIRYFASTEGGNDSWILFHRKRFASFFFNIIYAWLVLFLVFTFYAALNGLIAVTNTNGDSAMVGVEPVLFGLVYAAADLLIVGARNLLRRIVADAKAKK